MTRSITGLLLAFSIPVIAHAQQPDFTTFSNAFVKGYQSLNLPSLQLSYVTNLEHIQSPDGIREQLAFFKEMDSRLKLFRPNQLDSIQRDDYLLARYETELNLERLSLEQQWTKPATGIPATGLYTLPNSKAWYAYFLKKWVAATVTPDEIYQFGLQEVEKVKQKIAAIQIASGMDEASFYKHLNDPSFFIQGADNTQHAFENTRQIILNNLPKLFYPTAIPPIAIRKGADEALAQTPGYYSGNTFYFNFFDKPYNNRQVDWLFIHEGIPGHHYQASLAAQANRSPMQQLFYYLGFSEGWAAYTESLGKELGVYKTLYDELGKWEWDLVRSVRVPLDVGLNYYGWTDEQAMTFWKEHIRNQDDIALREITRMKRWPAQVVTYKYGAAQIEKWKTTLQHHHQFDIKRFHQQLLEKGSLPLFMVAKHVLGEG